MSLLDNNGGIFAEQKSVAISRKRTPSVMNLMDVVGAVVTSYRIWYETFDVGGDNSCPTRAAIETAATRRG
jgi:hypothetical protein